VRLILVALAIATFIVAPTALAADGACASDPQFAAAAKQNARSLTDQSFAPFGRTERGWRIYEPQTAATIGTACGAETPGFAASLATWQRAKGLAATGEMTAATLGALKQQWQRARPFVGGGCPAAPGADQLADANAREEWGGKPAQLRPGALDALRRMAAAARQENPAIAADQQMLTIVSAFRSPAYDAGRCQRDGNCNGIARARCSAHRTGRAMDLYVGAAPGQSPVSSNDANRLFQSRTATYRWLVANAHRFGFVNYVFEPWHWEWTGTDARVAASGPTSGEH